jgi:uncharacterized protein
VHELRVIAPSYAPVSTLMLYLTEDCNLRCTYCFVKKTPRAMSMETARKSVDFYLHREISGNLRHLGLTFFGGEPFMALDTMQEIIRYAGEVGARTGKTVHFAATTNATIATSQVEQIVREAGIHLLVSVDGGEDAMASRPYVGGGSPWKAVSRNLARLVAWSPSVVARMTYHPEALDLVANVRRVLELGAPSVSLCPVVESTWRGSEERLDEAYEELGDWFLSEARAKRYLPLYVTWRLLRLVHKSHRGEKRPSRPCPVGTSLIAIDPDGHVMPCHRYLYRPDDWFGTVDVPRFPAKREKYVRITSRELLGCDGCSAEPVCGGGCRMLVVAERLNLHSGIHPGHCLNTRAHARVAYRIYNTLMQEQPAEFTAALCHDHVSAQAFGELAI